MSLTLEEQDRTLALARWAVADARRRQGISAPACHLADGLESTARALQHHQDTGQTSIAVHCIVVLLTKSVGRALRGGSNGR